MHMSIFIVKLSVSCLIESGKGSRFCNYSGEPILFGVGKTSPSGWEEYEPNRMEPMGNSAEAGTEIEIEIDYTYMYITDSGDYICK